MRDCLLRRSEAAGVRWRDLEREPDGSGRLTVPYSKTDQLGKGAILFVTKETMRAMWEIRPPTLKPGKRIFDCHPLHGLPLSSPAWPSGPGLHGDFSGHSPRIGMVQDLARLGALTSYPTSDSFPATSQ